MPSARDTADGELVELMKRYLRDDTAAFEALYARIQPVLRGVFRRLGVPDDRRDDLSQDVYVRAHRSRAQFDPARATDASIAAWYRRITEGVWFDRLRKESRRARRERNYEFMARLPSGPGNDPRCPERRVLADEARTRVRRAMSGLSRSQRQTLEYVRLQELTFAEASEELGVSVGALRVRAHRGHRALVRQLGSAG